MATRLEYDPEEAKRHLRASDERLAALIDSVGEFRLAARAQVDPFHGLLRAIVYQQLSGHAAGAIHARVLAAAGDGRRVDPERLLALDDAELRAAGLSRPKQLSVRSLAEHALDGTVPTRRQLRRLDDDEIIERLTVIRGIGRWTAEMLLLFELGRPDVFPVDDLGIRKGCMYLYGSRKLPSATTMQRRARPWRPYRSVASWYLWRAAERVPVARKRG